MPILIKSTVYSLQSTAKQSHLEDGSRKTEDSSGFTLIEVLVAIAIIGVVFGVIISSTTALQRNSRDTQRQGDLRNIQSALQQYYADQNFYPTSISAGATITNCTGNPASPCTVSKTYMSKVPADPQTGNLQYCYNPQISISNSGVCNNTSPAICNYYLLSAKVENGGSPVTCNGNATYNYQLTPIP